MKRPYLSLTALVVGLALLLVALANAARADAAVKQSVCIKSNIPQVTYATLRRDLPSFQKEADNVRRWWGGPQLSLRVGTCHWQILILGHSPAFGGWHTYDKFGPEALVFYDRNMWTIYVSHELAEMQVDPDTRPHHQRTAQGTYIWLVEVADPVELEHYLYRGVKLSDFVGPAWYNPHAAGPYDYMRQCRYPEEILPGGYATWWDGFSWSIQIQF